MVFNFDEVLAFARMTRRLYDTGDPGLRQDRNATQIPTFEPPALPVGTESPKFKQQQLSSWRKRDLRDKYNKLNHPYLELRHCRPAPEAVSRIKALTIFKKLMLL